MDLDSFVGKITENLKNNGTPENRIEEIEEKLRKKYFTLFQTEINEYEEIIEDKTDVFLNVEEQTVIPENTGISVEDFAVFQNEDEYDNPEKRETRIQQWMKHYDNLYEKTGVRVFDPDEEDEIDERGEFGRTMLHQAVIDKDKERIVKLIEKGADHTITDNSGITPFLQAVLDEDTEIIKLLKENGIKK